METSTHQRTAKFLSLVIAAGATIASLGGLLINDLYRDNLFVTSVWKANDFVTLVLAVPILIISIIFLKQKSKRAELIWLAMLDYMLYNYAFYLFAAAFNKLFLIYVALFTLSIFALIFGLINMDVKAIGQNLKKRLLSGGSADTCSLWQSV